MSDQSQTSSAPPATWGRSPTCQLQPPPEASARQSSPESATPQTCPTFASFREFALQIARVIWLDAHVNLSGLVFFLVLGFGIVRPEYKEQCAQICALAGTYLFGAAKNK